MPGARVLIMAFAREPGMDSEVMDMGGEKDVGMFLWTESSLRRPVFRGQHAIDFCVMGFMHMQMLIS